MSVAKKLNLYAEISKCIYRNTVAPAKTTSEGGVKEKYSGIRLSASIPHKQISAEVTGKHTYVPLETFDLEANLPENCFTVGTVVEYKAPETSRNGKTFSTFKISNLVKYDTSKLNKHVLVNEKFAVD